MVLKWVFVFGGVVFGELGFLNGVDGAFFMDGLFFYRDGWGLIWLVGLGNGVLGGFLFLCFWLVSDCVVFLMGLVFLVCDWVFYNFKKVGVMDSFASLIQGDKLVLVDFFAEWCGPCKMMKPILVELKALVGDSVQILKVDIDKNRSLAALYGVQSVPTLVLFRGGKVLWRQAGVMRAAQLQELLLSFK